MPFFKAGTSVRWHGTSSLPTSSATSGSSSCSSFSSSSPSPTPSSAYSFSFPFASASTSSSSSSSVLSLLLLLLLLLAHCTPQETEVELETAWGAALENGVSAAYTPGQQLLPSEMFKAGEVVDVRGTSIGKGWQGAVKKYGFSRGLMTHGRAVTHNRSHTVLNRSHTVLNRSRIQQTVPARCQTGA